MDLGKRNTFWHEKKVLNEMISGLVVEINERTRFIKLLSKQKPEPPIQSRINQEQLAIGILSSQCQGLVQRLAIVELMLAVSNN